MEVGVWVYGGRSLGVWIEVGVWVYGVRSLGVWG